MHFCKKIESHWTKKKKKKSESSTDYAEFRTFIEVSIVPNKSAFAAESSAASRIFFHLSGTFTRERVKMNRGPEATRTVSSGVVVPQLPRG